MWIGYVAVVIACSGGAPAEPGTGAPAHRASADRVSLRHVAGGIAITMQVPAGTTLDGEDGGQLVYLRRQGARPLPLYLDPGTHAPGVDLPCVSRHPDSGSEFAICAVPGASDAFHVVGYNSQADVSCGGGTVTLDEAREIATICASLR
jgi:hypothetical protein